MSFDTIRLETDATGIVTLTLARPEKHNAMNAEMIAELTRAAAELSTAEGVRAVVLAAEGESFCAGADLGWMRAQMEADRAARIAEARRLADMLSALDRLPLPLVARVQGQAYGGGIGLISVSDVAIGVEGARFALTETRLGLIPATIGPYVVARLGAAKARGVFFSAARFGAGEAVDLGLLSRAVARDALDEAVAETVRPYLATAPGAVAEAKALLRRLAPPIPEATIAASVEALADRWETEEARAGVAAFFDKRPAPWAGQR
ncbi:MAG: crotonase/enoyl-CoA hydratase family protein [Paracoccaceae bacterium]